MRDRYHETFAALRARGEGAFVPFTVLGDPDPETSLAIVRALVHGGADALELGIPFSDPVADGPVILAANQKAIKGGSSVKKCFDFAGKPESHFQNRSFSLGKVFQHLIDFFAQRLLHDLVIVGNEVLIF